MIEEKSLSDFIKDDPSLLAEVSYDEFCSSSNNCVESDCSISDAYTVYTNLVDQYQQKFKRG